MVKTIYADILFLINFIINYLILFTSGHIGTQHIRRWRLFLAATTGAIYGVAAFFPSLPFITSFPVKLAVSALMALISFGKANILKNTLLFLGVSLAFGGAVFAATLLGFGDFCEVRGGVYYIHLSLSTLLFTSLCTYVLLSVIFHRAAARADRKFSEVTVRSNEHCVAFTALHDTGNSLREPGSNAHIVISDYSTLRGVLPESARELMDSTSPETFSLLLDKLSVCGEFKLIPYKTVGSDFSLMLTYRPQSIELDGKELSGALIGFCPYSVSDGGTYSAII